MNNSKPIIRWTIGHVYNTKTGYEILDFSIKNMLNLYQDEFEYFVCYNKVNEPLLKSIVGKYKKVNLFKQNWDDCPLDIDVPKIMRVPQRELFNGSLWKITPPRLSISTHEILLDNDVIFLKRPKLIEEFLSREDKNFIKKESTG